MRTRLRRRYSGKRRERYSGFGVQPRKKRSFSPSRRRSTPRRSKSSRITSMHPSRHGVELTRLRRVEPELQDLTEPTCARGRARLFEQALLLDGGEVEPVG